MGQGARGGTKHPMLQPLASDGAIMHLPQQCRILQGRIRPSRWYLKATDGGGLGVRSGFLVPSARQQWHSDHRSPLLTPVSVKYWLLYMLTRAQTYIHLCIEPPCSSEPQLFSGDR